MQWVENGFSAVVSICSCLLTIDQVHLGTSPANPISPSVFAYKLNIPSIAITLEYSAISKLHRVKFREAIFPSPSVRCGLSVPEVGYKPLVTSLAAISVIVSISQ